MYKYSYSGFIIVLFLFYSFVNRVSAQEDKSRLIVTTDLGGSDPDDIQSMIHLLLCSDLVDLEGLISAQAWVDDPDKTEALRITVEQFIEVLPNLQKHSSGYPTAEKLRSLIKRGQVKAHMSGVGAGLDSPGSQLIVQAIKNSKDKRPLWLAAWGGMNTIAQAIWFLRHSESEKQFRKYLSRIRIYDILGQDDAGAYIAKNYPDIPYIRNTEVYGWAPDDTWTRENIQSRMPLGNHYPNRIWATEGDSPSFLYVLSNGLNVPEHPDFGGWGGRFDTEKKKNIRGMDFIEKSGKTEKIYDDYYMIFSASEGVKSIKRWEDHIRNDFAARMLWSQESDFAKVNHHPIVVVNGKQSKLPTYIKVKPGQSINLSAEGTTDPDGNPLSYKWSVYDEPSSYSGKVLISDSTSQKCSITFPETSAGSKIHIILEVTDNGQPSLTSYHRVVIEIEG